MGRGKTGTRLRDFTANDVAAVASQLRTILAEVEEFQHEIEGAAFSGSLSIDGGDAVYDGLEGIVGWLYKARGKFKIRGLRPVSPPANGVGPKRKGKG